MKPDQQQAGETDRANRPKIHRERRGSVSGNASRKHKQYKLRQERRKFFGDIGPRDETGKVDLVAYAAAQGRIITAGTVFRHEKMPVRSKT